MKTNVPNEAQLLQKAKQYDRQVLAQIYDIYSPGLYRYALRLLGDPSQAEDCVSETFSRFLQALRASKGPKDYLQAYLYRTAHNWIADQYRRVPIPPEKLDESQPDDDDLPEEEVGKRHRQRQVRVALRKLTPDQQQVIALKFFEEWTNEDIAQALKKPVGAIKSLQHRALASLQRILEKQDLP
jgi:RNA polymerase sigma-70 factor (ECF subfamily)